MSDLQQFWDESHVSYSQQGWIDQPSYFAEEIVKFLPQKGKILDLATGQGQDARFFSKQGYQVTALDLSEHAIDLAKQKAEAEKLSIDFHKFDFSEPLPFDNETFDVVYSHLGLHHFCKEDTVKLFTEINRVLSSNGIFATLLNSIIDPELQEFGYEEIEPHYFKHLETGICQSYFSPDYVKDITPNLFEELLLDNKGRSRRNENQNLVRFVGKKI